MEGDIFAIWGRLGAVLGILSVRMRRNGGISTSGQKYDVTKVYGVPDFLWGG